MNTKQMIGVAVFSFVLLPLAAATAVNDGLFFDLGFKEDVNKNGKADYDEVGNLLTIGKADGWDRVQHGLPTSTSGQDPVRFETVKVPIGYWKRSVLTNEMTVLKFPQGTAYDADGRYLSAQQTVRLIDNYPNINARSGLIRFRWDGYAFTNKVDAVLFGDCWNWSTKKGMAFFINASSDSLAVWVGQASTANLSTDCVIAKEKWYDIAFRIGNEVVNGEEKAKIRLAIACEGVVKWYEYANLPALDMNENVHRILLGGQENGESDWAEYQPTSGNKRKAFKGAFANVKLWSRELSDEELLAVLAGHDGLQWSIGVKNGSAIEFGGQPIEVFDPAVHAWAMMRQKLTPESPALTFKTKMIETDVALQKSLRVIPLLSEGATGEVTLSVNGVDVEAARFQHEKEHVFVIPAAMWTECPDGYVTVVLRRTGNVSGTLAFDALSLSGGWQVGYADKSVLEYAPNEGFAPEDYFVGDTDISNHVRRAVYSDQSSRPNRFKLHFWVDGRLAKNSPAVFSSVIPNKEDNKNMTPFKVYLNNQCIYETELSCGGIEVQIPRETMKAGLNVVEIKNCSPSDSVWTQFDYFRMEFKKEYSSFTVVSSEDTTVNEWLNRAKHEA